MLHRLAADGIALIHFAFVLFVCLGALLVLRWRPLMWLQIPAALWGIWIEFSGGACPLTPVENSLRLRGGQAGYSGGFVEHYLTAVLYPAGLSRPVQFILGTVVVLLNLVIYWYVFRGRGPAFASSSAEEHHG